MTAIVDLLIVLLLALGSAVGTSAASPVRGAIEMPTGAPMTPQGAPSAPTPAAPATEGLGVRAGGAPPHLIPPACSGPCPAPALAGQATWWDTFGHGYYAAIRPDLGSKGDLAVVCGGKPFHCLTVPIITTCLCRGPGSGRLIDLSRDAFAEFADPSRGVVRISLQMVPMP